MSEMLVEKYRPDSLDEIIGHENLIRTFKGYVKSGEMNNVVLHGPPGTGKTASAIALAKEFGVYPGAFLELNASDERGIDIVRTTIKNFARSKSIEKHPFKIILLDEAEELTKPAQQALRRTMENTYKTCRYILTVNNLSGIRPPLRSRCLAIPVTALSIPDLYKLVTKVVKAEGLEFEASINKMIVKVANGDARKALNIVEGLQFIDEPTQLDVYNLSGAIDEENVWKIMFSALKGDYGSITSLRDAMDAGVSPSEITRMMYYTALNPKRMKKDDALMVLEALGDMPYADEKYQIMSSLAKIVRKRS